MDPTRKSTAKPIAAGEDRIRELIDEAEAYTPPVPDPDQPLVDRDELDRRLANLPMNDIGNAQRFRERHGQDFFHVPHVGWHAWNGRFWDPEGVMQARRAVHATIGAIFGEARALRLATVGTDVGLAPSSDSCAGLLMRHAIQSGTSGSITAMLTESVPYCSIDIDSLDTDPLLFNVQNGTLEISAAGVRLRPHRRGDRITKMAPVTYDPKAAAPQFMAYLDRVQRDPEAQEGLQRLYGYALTDLIAEQTLVFNFGPGGNGKSVLQELMRRIMGPYATVLPVARHNDRADRRRGCRMMDRPRSGSILVPARRAYLDGRFGQMHYRFSEPAAASGKPALLLFHMSPYSSIAYENFVQEMGKDRRAFAVDTPGFGASDPPPSLPEIADYAAAMGDVMDRLGLRTVDLMGYHTGSKIALALARARPQQVRRVVNVSASVFTDAELAEHRAMYAAEDLADDGTHLLGWWRSARKWHMREVSNTALQTAFAARVARPDISWWGHRAAFNFQVKDELPKVEQPVLILNPEDDLVAFTPRAKPLLKHPRSRIHDLPGWSHGFLDLRTAEAARLVRDFLDD